MQKYSAFHIHDQLPSIKVTVHNESANQIAWEIRGLLSAIGSKNLIKNLFSLNCVQLSQNTRTILPDFRKCRFLYAGFYCIFLSRLIGDTK